MKTTRKTGLGDSLLLQRTEPAPETIVPAPTDVPASEPMSIPTPPPPQTEVEAEPALPEPVSKKQQKVKLVLRDRCTLYLERTVNEQLGMVARIEGRERSDIASDILRKHLPKYRIEREK